MSKDEISEGKYQKRVVRKVLFFFFRFISSVGQGNTGEEEVVEEKVHTLQHRG